VLWTMDSCFELKLDLDIDQCFYWKTATCLHAPGPQPPLDRKGRPLSSRWSLALGGRTIRSMSTVAQPPPSLA
jgi:hypothetical protein